MTTAGLLLNILRLFECLFPLKQLYIAGFFLYQLLASFTSVLFPMKNSDKTVSFPSSQETTITVTATTLTTDHAIPTDSNVASLQIDKCESRHVSREGIRSPSPLLMEQRNSGHAQGQRITFSICSFNIWCPVWKHRNSDREESRFPDRWKKRNQDILDILCRDEEGYTKSTSINADIYCLQEFCLSLSALYHIFERERGFAKLQK